VKFGHLAAVACLFLAGSAVAQTRSDKASVRLIAAGDLSGGVYRAAIIIDLAPDTLTYWRNPGEAGVPPVFDWSGSQNVSRAEVAMPAPSRIEEAGGDVFGYRTRVAYAVTIAPADAAKPVQAALKMDYAACEKICIPMHAEARLDLAPQGKAGPDAADVAAAEAAIPRQVAASEAAMVSPVAGSAKPAWLVRPKTADARDLFAEGPEGYFFETAREGTGAFRLTMAEKPAAPAAGPLTVRLTLAAPAGAQEFSLSLDAGAQKP
jgi:DsbC/DsbD-like thiol-disulfide interchange protein